MNEAVQRRLFGLAAVAIAGSALAYISMADLGENLVYYWSPTELIQNAHAGDALVRLGGMVVAGSLDWDRDAQHATFAVTDGQTQVPVACKGNPTNVSRDRSRGRGSPRRRRDLSLRTGHGKAQQRIPGAR